jgi:hypothetical protein
MTTTASSTFDAADPPPADAAVAHELTDTEWQKHQAAYEAGVKACARVTYPCNPPPPPPPRVVRGEVLDGIESAPGELTINLRVTSEVGRGRRGVFVDDRGTPIPGTEFVVAERLAGSLVRVIMRGNSVPSRAVRFVAVGD